MATLVYRVPDSERSDARAPITGWQRVHPQAQPCLNELLRQTWHQDSSSGAVDPPPPISSTLDSVTSRIKMGENARCRLTLVKIIDLQS